MANIRRRSMMLMEGHSSLAFRIIVSEEAEVARKLFANAAYQTRAASFDHLVGAGEQRWRHSEAEYPCRRVIDDKLELGGLHNRQVRRFCTLEDATSIDTDLTIRIRQAGSVAHQSADFGIFTRPIRGRDRMARRQKDQLDTSAD